MSKIYVVHDQDGKILAASTVKNLGRPVYDGGKPMAATGAKIPPARSHGVTTSEVEVPAKFGDKKMHEFLPLLKVDVKTGHLKEK